MMARERWWMSEALNIYVVDAGSVARKRCAWVSSTDPDAHSIDLGRLAQAIGDDLSAGRRIALGVECPLFIPCPDNWTDLGKAREGDCTPETGNRPWSASAGACSTMIGLAILGWVLRKVKDQHPSAVGTTDWSAFSKGETDICVWEAFVSGRGKGSGGSHHADALRALRAFQDRLGRGEMTTDVTAEQPVSLAGALILWAGLSDDVSLLHQGCIVVRLGR